MRIKKTSIMKYIVMVLAVLFAVMAIPFAVNAEGEGSDEQEYNVTVHIYSKYDGKYEEIDYTAEKDEEGYVHIDISSFNSMTVTGFGSELVKAEYDGVDVTDVERIDEIPTKDKTLTIYVDRLFENVYNFFNVDGVLVSQIKDRVNVAESKKYKIKKFSIDDVGLDKDQAKNLKIYGYGMTATWDPIVKPDPNKDTIYKTGKVVKLEGPKNFNVAYEYAEFFNIVYNFNGTTLSPKSYPTSKWETDFENFGTFEKKPFTVKLGIINGIDIFTENDFYVAPLSMEGYKFVGWKDESTGTVYENGTEYTITPVTEKLLEPKESTEIILTAQWEEDSPEPEPEPDPGKTDYSNEWVDGKWYNADGTQTYDGIMSWKQNAKGWWIEDTKGWYAKAQWQKIDGKWYYFTEDGYMDYSEYRDGCWLGADGAWDMHYFGGRWLKDANGWWYEDGIGWYPQDQSLWIDGVKYHFLETGYWDGK